MEVSKYNDSEVHFINWMIRLTKAKGQGKFNNWLQRLAGKSNLHISNSAQMLSENMTQKEELHVYEKVLQKPLTNNYERIRNKSRDFSGIKFQVCVLSITAKAS